MKNKKYKVASLFSGGGGMDLGFSGGFRYKNINFPKTGFEIVFANDIDIDATNTYTFNTSYLDKNTFISGDIRNVLSSDIPYFDILIAGFPCQPFSNAGNRKGVNDEDGRGTLWHECERIIKNSIETHNAIPKAFVLENVRGIMSSKTDNGNTVPEEIKNRMELLGFKVSMKLLKTSDYGVPQNRYRFIIVGVSNDMSEFSFEHLDSVVNQYNLPNLDKNYYDLTLGSVLCGIKENFAQQKDYWKYSPQAQKMVDLIKPCEDGLEKLYFFSEQIPLNFISPTIEQGRSWKNINPKDLSPRFKKIYENPKKYRSPNFYRRFALGEISGTITASAQPENCGITHPFENRRMSIREIASIQSFPNDFIFPYKSIQSAYKVIGNAVPPVFAWVIANALKIHIENQI